MTVWSAPDVCNLGRGEGRSRERTELQAVENTGVGAGTSAVKDLDGDNIGRLGDTEGLAANGTSDVAAVTVLVVILRFVSTFSSDPQDDINLQHCRQC